MSQLLNDMFKMNQCSNDKMAVSRTISFPRKPAQTVTDDDDDDEEDESLTDVSVFLPTPESVEHQSINLGHDEFVPNDQLLQSLVAYANSFQLDETVYSIQDFQTQLEPLNTPKKPFYPSTGQNVTYPKNGGITRHRSYEDLTPTDFYVSKQQKGDYDDRHSDGSTAITDGSKFDWEISSKKSCHSYPTTDTTQELSSSNRSQKLRSTPIIIREKPRAIFVQGNINIPFLRLSTPIIVREILHESSRPQQPIPKHHRTPSTTTFPLQHQPMASYNRELMYEPTHQERHVDDNSKQIFIEYDQINVKVDQNVKQRKEIKRVSPYRYLQQHGPTLYAQDIFQNLLHNII